MRARNEIKTQMDFLIDAEARANQDTYEMLRNAAANLRKEAARLILIGEQFGSVDQIKSIMTRIVNIEQRLDQTTCVASLEQRRFRNEAASLCKEATRLIKIGIRLGEEATPQLIKTEKKLVRAACQKTIREEYESSREDQTRIKEEPARKKEEELLRTTACMIAKKKAREREENEMLYLLGSSMIHALPGGRIRR